jgi:hypothetical protein
VPEIWTPWTVEWRARTERIDRQQSLDDSHALLSAQPTGYASIDRQSRHTTLELEAEPSTDAWAHPHLGSTALMHAYWAGWPNFHAGVFALGGKAFAVLGEREDGKSSTLAWLTSRGHTVLSDDLLIVSDGDALVGPRCLDLRESAAAHFGLGEPLGVVGTRERWRVKLSDATAATPLAGFVTLAWESAPGVTRVPLAERWPSLQRGRGLRVGEIDAQRYLELLALPMLRFARPRDWNTLDAAMDMLLEALAAI